MTDAPAPSALPLDGVRVLDLTFNIAGPYATMILGDLGADVLKVERPGGDDARRMTPVHGEGSAYFYAINRNKRAVTLDLREPADRAEFDGLLGGSDVFVSNLRVNKLRDLSLDYESLHPRFPKLVYADLSGYGSDGSEAERAGYDMVLQARSGLMSVTGEPGRPPVRVGVSILDMGSGLWLALGVLAALQVRERTGVGVRVSTSLLEVGTAFMAYDVAAFQLTGELPEPRGSGHPAFAPYGAFRAADGFVAIGVGADHIFSRLAHAVGRPEWTRDERYASNAARVAHRRELRDELEAELVRHPVRHWIGTLIEAGVPADEVSDVAALMSDPQLDAIGCWVDMPLPGRPVPGPGGLRLPGLPVRFQGSRPPVRTGPPELAARRERDR